jgi:hypothetical protein
METDNYSNIIKNLGVKDPNKPSEKELELVISAYIKDREIYGDIYKSYLNSIQTIVSSYINFSIKALEGSDNMTEKVFDHLHFTKIIIAEQLNSNLTFEQKEKLLILIEKADERVEKEAAKNRKFKKYVIDRTTLVTLAGITIAGGIYSFSKFLNTKSGQEFATSTTKVLSENSGKITGFLKDTFTSIMKSYKG